LQVEERVKLYTKTIPSISRDILHELLDNQDIEVEEENLMAARADFEAILIEYSRAERDLADVAKDVMAARGWSNTKFSEAKRIAAQTRKLPLGEEALDYVINQMLEFMLISPHFDEVYAEDHVMRKRIVDVLRRYLKLNQDLDAEVRNRLKHLQEGTRDWEIAYRKTLEEVQRAKGLI
jgi:hypothetical protein